MKMKCARCIGEGEIPKSVLDWKVAGRALKRGRLDRGLSQRQEADRRGIGIIELSRMEAGIEEPVDYDAERG